MVNGLDEGRSAAQEVYANHDGVEMIVVIRWILALALAHVVANVERE